MVIILITNSNFYDQLTKLVGDTVFNTTITTITRVTVTTNSNDFNVQNKKVGHSSTEHTTNG